MTDDGNKIYTVPSGTVELLEIVTRKEFQALEKEVKSLRGLVFMGMKKKK